MGIITGVVVEEVSSAWPFEGLSWWLKFLKDSRQDARVFKLLTEVFGRVLKDAPQEAGGHTHHFITDDGRRYLTFVGQTDRLVGEDSIGGWLVTW